MSYLDTYLGQLDAALSDPAVMELAINADGTIWEERSGQIHMGPSGLAPLPARSVRDLATQIANSTANTFTEAAPLVSAAVRYRDLMLRCQVVGAPAVSGGTVIGIRVFRSRLGDTKRAPRSFSFLRGQEKSLEEERRAMVAEIRAGSEEADVDAFLGRLVSERLNIIVAGGTSTGKTTLTNALLAEVAKSSDRVVLIEDTRELQCQAQNLVALRTKEGVSTLTDLVRASLRLRPDRIPIGEVRGPEALDLLKAWGTGHPGGVGTIHAGSGLGALRRLEQLIQEAVVTVPRALIAETINIIAVLSGRGSERRLKELVQVQGLDANGDYRLTNFGENK